jgi:hypothetical protein
MAKPGPGDQPPLIAWSGFFRFLGKEVLMIDRENYAGFTVADTAKRYRVSPDKVRKWITTGELFAISTANAHNQKPRYLVPPEAISVFEKGRQAAAPPKPPRRKRKQQSEVDYFPND